jgi:hypothetical protein
MFLVVTGVCVPQPLNFNHAGWSCFLRMLLVEGLTRPTTCCLSVLAALLHAAAELERRYREGQAVYEEVMLHRPPGVRGTCAWVALSPAVT